jgi:hypothetical protein
MPTNKPETSAQALPGHVASTDRFGVGEPRDAEGPRGTYGCACLDRDSVQCAAIRYGMDHWGDACQCICHQWSDDDECY